MIKKTNKHIQLKKQKQKPTEKNYNKTIKIKRRKRSKAPI